MKLIAGLGNPEPRFELNRHNAGFLTAELLAKKLGTTFRRTLKRAKIASAVVNGEKIIIAKPQTYMNLSGESIAALSDYYKIAPEDILVIVDEVNLPFGKIRLRAGGSAGGHNGMKNISLNLATEDFPRLRIGVGIPGVVDSAHGEMKDYVLSDFSKEEQKILPEVTGRAAEAALMFCREGIAAAMNSFNGERKEKPDD